MPPVLGTDLASLVTIYEQAGDDIAVVSPFRLRHRKFSYKYLADLGHGFASELDSRAIRDQQRVLFWAENSGEWIAAFLGCLLQGALPVPIDAGSDLPFASRIIEETKPSLILTTADRIAQLGEAGSPVLDLDRLSSIVGSHRPHRAKEGDCSAATRRAVSETTPVQIIFTSGTTAEPKGIVHTHGNVLASLIPIQQEIGKYDRYRRPFHPIRILHTLPLSHVFGQFMGLWIPSLLRAEIHFERRLVPSDLIRRIHDRRISVLAAVPRLLDLMEEELLETVPGLLERLARARTLPVYRRWWTFADVHRRFGFKFWAVISGGASLASRSEEFWRTLGFAVVQGYGMTETTALISVNHPFKLAQGTVGKVLPGREVQLAPDGEVLVRGETIAQQVWRAGEIQPTGAEWLATGDLAEMDSTGHLRFRGRKKDVIVTSAGLNIFPGDLETALKQHPDVQDAAVIEAAAANGPEAVAVLLLRANHTAEARDIVAAANRSLASYQQIQRWRVWPELDFPRTATGKIRKRVLSAEYSGSSQQEPGENATPLDSLGRVQLQAKIEAQYGIAVNDEVLQSVQSAEELPVVLAKQRQRTTPPRSSRDHVFPKWPWSRPIQMVRGVFLKCVAMPLLRFLAAPKRFSDRTTKRAIEVKGPLLIVANHITSYDAPFVLFGLPPALRSRVAIAMSGEWILDWRNSRNQGHWFLNLLGPLVYVLVTALFNVFPLPRLAGVRNSFMHAGEAVDRGYSILIFPEGRRSPDGRPQPFERGAGLLWAELAIPALPVRIQGLGELKSSGQRWFRSGKVSVDVGPLLPAPDNQDPALLTKLLESATFPVNTSQIQ